MTPEKLASQIHELRYQAGGDPFGLFVAEAMRASGLPIRDRAPEGQLAEETREVVESYFDLVTSNPPFTDILSPTYMSYREGAKAHAGQFFTPWSLCQMIAQATLDDWTPRPHPEGKLWSILEPACGAGATLLAALDYLCSRYGPDVLRMWKVVGWDIDLTVARVAALQVMMTLTRHEWALGEVVVIHGDTLSQEVRSIVIHGVAAPREASGPPQLEAPAIREGGQFEIFAELGAA